MSSVTRTTAGRAVNIFGLITELQDQISQLGSIATVGGERLDATEAIQADIANLTRRVADASDKLPPYDQKHYAEVRSLESQSQCPASDELLTHQLPRSTGHQAPHGNVE